ncbi:MAG: nucleotide exchange factor GrpE [Bacteroidia bacterium]|nr:nucleotide exchange factor GrpE [Bacteroidia bacterium]NNF30306.1 nucleotide exchange factor GrpE [Flavobacteriaceae bacterium]MBT8276382.1 nucleotide exchange factor GrpE [Bacteroidia bacterium]NNJ80981.1 nucleotide exchange factor GrpE [Flavobacteriaceae bacterium]NNK53549.1 nucleotide exchange factor GrpE [Flavobacteriaceae bacterium]
MSKKTKKATAVAEEEIDMNNTETSAKQSKKAEKKISEIEHLSNELQNEKDRYLRLFAEFENYKKRTGRERIELFKTASEDVMVSLLPVIDDFDRALKEIEKSHDDNLYKGVELISNKLRETLKSKGLEAVGTQKGDIFDAEIHEAVTQIPSPSDDMKGKIIDVIEKGYKLGDKIIRFPKVVIGQ